MTRIKRTIAAVAALAAASLALTACTGGGKSTAGITYWGAFYSPDTEKVFQELFVDGFNDSGNGTVKMEVKELTTIAKLTDTAVAAGQAPDIIYAGGPSPASDFARAGRTIALDGYASKYGWEQKLLPWAYELSKVDGKPTSVPTGYGSMVLYYNKAVFAEHGWTAPTTLAEFEKVAAAADDAGLVPLGGGNAGYQGMTEWLLTAVFNAAVGPDKLYDVLSGKASFADPEFVAAVELVQDWIAKGWLAGGAESYFTTDDTANVTGLANGTTAMYFSGTWAFNSMSQVFENPDDWAWAPLPSLSDAVSPGVYPLAIGTALSVSADSKDPDTSAAFLDYLIGDVDRALEYTARTGENPPPLAITADQFPDSVDDRTVALYTAIPESTNVGYASWTFLSPKANAYLITEFDKVVTGDRTAAEYLDGLQKTFKEEFDAGKTLTPFTPAGRK
jgi:raffinose/stachyose/melibiose transport system substrate-binding protein